MTEIEQMSEFFNNRAEGYDEHMLSFLNCKDEHGYYRMISNDIKETQDKIEILDLGCGTGIELEEIFRKCPNANVTGVDMSEGMLDKLRDKYSRFKDQIHLIKGSYLDIVLPNNKYDYVISSMTMHHFTYELKKQLYMRIKNYLKRNSGIYIEGDYVVDEGKEKQYLEEYDEKMNNRDKNIYHIDIPFTIETQKKLFIEAGFSMVEVIYRERDAAIFVVS